MTAFVYQALNAQGKQVNGTLEADSAKAARAALRAQSLAPVSVQEAQVGAARRWQWGAGGGSRAVLRQADLAVWTRQLASLVGAGLTIERALHSLGEEAEDEASAALVADLLSQVKAGSAFSQALQQHPATFDAVYCSVVAAGERSGALDRVLGSLADDLEASLQLRSKLLGAALYPAIVSGIAVLIVVFLMVYVLPQVAGAFASSKRSLPLLTTVMLWISAQLRAGWPWLLLAAVLAAVGLRSALRHTATRLQLHAAVLRWPLVGKLVRNYHAARFAGTLGMLASAGVPILPSLQSAADTVGNLAMRRDLDDVGHMVREGAPLGVALAQKPRFPPLLSTFARMGSETGQLGPMLAKVGAQLAGDVQRRAMYLASVLEPLLIVVMGVVVMLIVLAVLMPIIELNSFVK